MANILIMATDGFEQSELLEPRKQLTEAGHVVHVATPKGASIRGWDENDWGDTVEADLAIDAVDPQDYAALVLPGGQINPDKLRTNDTALGVIRAFADSGRTVAAICHAPWLLIEARLVEGREVTSFASIRTDLENAGARWVDRAVARDGGLVTSRDPDDLDAFCAAIDEAVGRGGTSAGQRNEAA